MNKQLKLNTKLKDRATKVNANLYKYRDYRIERFISIVDGKAWRITKNNTFCAKCRNVKEGKAMIDSVIKKIEADERTL